ncbi:NAD-binding protein [Salinarchaeum sp. IM2453]|uniref:NAD-binding protein n=1 Tax=Salinarchaeum sp. IM2453 TaxID=2862870 RepID=UPI001C8392B6|nr:NAD-binding protein [Salinarchaeum sp. IM2453]QZA89348.1 NAD-binding protein [Salinarchaeum sp. IM2453]
MSAEINTSINSARGSQFGVGLVFAVGVVAVITGIVHITYTPISGVLEPYIPEVIQGAVGFTGTVTGFILMVSGYSLHQRYRVGYYLALVFLPIATIQGIVQSSIASLPLIILSLIALVIVHINRSRFQEQVDMTPAQLAAMVALAGVQLYGTVGTYSLRDQFDGVNSVLDAFYFTIVTASTVGYGDIEALTAQARLFTISVLVLGTASFAVALGVLLGPMIEARLAASLGRVRDRQLSQLEDHIIILGWSELTSQLIEELSEKVHIVVIAREDSGVPDIQNQERTTLVGDPTEENILERARIERAKSVIVATTDDSKDAFAILTAREITGDAQIIATAANSENVSKLERAGANVVLDPAHVGAQLLVDSTLRNNE